MHCCNLSCTTEAHSAGVIYCTRAQPATVCVLTVCIHYKCSPMVSALTMYTVSAFTLALALHTVECTNIAPVSALLVDTADAQCTVERT